MTSLASVQKVTTSHTKQRRVADDKIVEHKASHDDIRFMMQLGVIGAASPQYEPTLMLGRRS